MADKGYAMGGKHQVDAGRRAFLSRAAAVGGALGLGPGAVAAAAQQQARPAGSPTVPAHPDAEAELRPPPPLSPLTHKKSGSDFMVDVLKRLDIKYVAANPGASFRGLHESIINYGANTKPEFLTCCHEESSVAMAHGYHKITGKPMAALVHGTVGLQHASMAIYNAYADRVPVLVIAGNSLDANTRRPGVEWQHSVQDCAAMVRDFTKWDDMPVSLQHFADSQVRAIKIATAVPMGPVVLTLDVDLQEAELPPAEEAALSVPALSLDRAPLGDPNAVDEAARLLVAAEHPLIVADRYNRTAEAIPLLVELAELLDAPVIDTGDRFNFPSRHRLNLSDDRALLGEADVILALEMAGLWSLSNSLRDVPGRPWKPNRSPSAKVISLGTAGMMMKSNYQDFQRYAPAEMSITGDAQATLPYLIQAVRSRLGANRKTQVEHRVVRLADRARAATERRKAMVDASWNLKPISTQRLVLELWEQIKNDDWSLVGYPHVMARYLWPMEKPYSHTGGMGAAGLGYGASAAVGAALANRDAGRLSIAIQPDGDLMYAPGVLWSAAHHRIPLLFVMFNNRAYHQEVMHMQRMANRHERGLDRYHIGTSLRDPDIDFAGLARSMGLFAAGPITEPDQLRPALQRALAVVRRGEPALVDVITQPR